MPSLKVTLCQMAVGADKTKNLQKAVSMITDAASRGSQFVVLPECFNCPYGTSFFEAYSEALCPGNQTYDAMSSVAKSNNVWLVAGSIPEKKDGKLYNSSMTFSPEGHLAHVHRKVHLFRLFTDAVKFDEAEVLTAGDDASAIKMSDDLLFGVAICFDIRYPQLAWKLASEGTSFIVYPGAFNMVTGPAHWELSARARAVDNQQYVLLCSPARDTGAGYVAWGHSLVVDPLGKVIASADEKEGYVDAELDLDLVAKTRDQIPIFKGQRKDLYSLAWGSGK